MTSETLAAALLRGVSRIKTHLGGSNLLHEDAVLAALSRAIAALPAVTVGVNESSIHRAVLDWIRDDTGAAIKMTITPDQANALTARIRAALEPVAAPDPAAIREAALREAAAACRQAETDWNAIAYEKRQAGRDDNFACASASASRKNANAILTLIPKKGAADDRA